MVSYALRQSNVILLFQVGKYCTECQYITQRLSRMSNAFYSLVSQSRVKSQHKLLVRSETHWFTTMCIFES